MRFEKNERVRVVGVRDSLLGIQGKIGSVISCDRGVAAVAIDDDPNAYRYLYTDDLESVEVKSDPSFDDELILDTAKRLVYGDRNAQYGHPADDYERNAGMFNALFKDKLKEDFTPRDLILFMILLKLSRAYNEPDKLDTIVDIAGYAQCHQRITRRLEGKE